MTRIDKTATFVERQTVLREKWTAPPKTDKFRVVTWNVHRFEGPVFGQGEDTRRDCARLLASLLPDVVLLQEDPSGSNLLTDCGYHRGLTYSAHDAERGLSVVSRSPLTNVQVHKLSSTGEEERAAVLCESVSDMGVKYTVGCCHLEPYCAEEWNRQCLTLCNLMRGPTVLGGDFNSMAAPAALRRASLRADTNYRYTCWYSTRVDMVFTTSHFACSEAWAVPSALSDHRPVVVDYVMPH